MQSRRVLVAVTLVAALGLGEAAIFRKSVLLDLGGKVKDVPVPQVKDGEVPNVGETMGKEAGVGAYNPQKHLAATLGVGSGLLVQIVIFCIATYFVHKWHKEYVADGKEPHCGIWSILCCCCCSFLTCCWPIDVKEK